MVWLHTQGLIVLALEPVLLMGRGPMLRRRWPGFLAGVAPVLAGPVAYYASFNSWISHIHQTGWTASGLDWISETTTGHSGISLVLNATCTFLGGWGWIDKGDLPRWITLAELLGFGLILTTIGWALIPRRISDPPFAAKSAPAIAGGAVVRATLWIAAFLIVPPYIVYCTSVPHPSNGLPVWIALVLLAWLWRSRRPDLFPSGSDLHVLVGTAIVLLCACLAAWGYCTTHTLHPLWVPRYLGTSWPAAAIGTCALLRRISAAPLRWSALVLLLALNCVHTAAYLTLDTEPPRDRLAADVISAQSPNSTLRVYAGAGLLETADEDGVYLSNPVTRYYLLRVAQRTLSPAEFRYGLLDDWFKLRRTSELPRVAADVAADPKIDRVIVWTVLPKNAAAPSSEAMLALLGKNWACESVRTQSIRARWGLGETDRIERSVLARRQTNP
jgi:hypothetical protein